MVLVFDMPRKSLVQAKSARILIGTASWSDPGFVQHWYPKGMRAHERLGRRRGRRLPGYAAALAKEDRPRSATEGGCLYS